MKRNIKQKMKQNKLILALLILVVGFFLVYALQSNGKIAGFSIFEGENESPIFVDSLTLSALENVEFSWTPSEICEGIQCNLSYVKISGIINAEKSGSANIYLVDGDNRLKIFGKDFELTTTTSEEVVLGDETIEEVCTPGSEEVCEILMEEVCNDEESGNETIEVCENQENEVCENQEVLACENVTTSGIESVQNVTIEESEVYSFDDVCEETCSLPGFDKTSYKIAFELDDGISAEIMSITYQWEREEIIEEPSESESVEPPVEEVEQKDGLGVSSELENVSGATNLTDEIVTNETMINKSIVSESITNETSVLKVKEDIRYDLIIDSVNLSEAGELIVLFHHDYDEILPILVDGDINYALSSDEIGDGESATITIANYNDEYFRIKLGEESEVIAFGKPKMHNVKFIVKDSGGNVKNISVEFVDKFLGTLKYKKSGVQISTLLQEGEYMLNITFENSPVRSIEMDYFNMIENVSAILGVDSVPISGKFNKMYAIDPTGVNFTNATVRVIASGTELYKCKEWNFTEQSCYGNWTFFKRLVPGQEYTFILTPDDPGFGEIQQPGLKDAYIVEDKTTNTYGASTTLTIRSRTPNKNRRALVEFNVSLPSGVRVDNATLALYMIVAPGTTRNYDIHRITSSWEEGTGDNVVNDAITNGTTWSERVFGLTWTTAGGDYAATATDIIATGITANVWLSWNVSEDVKGFYNGSYPNYGWLIKDNVEEAPNLQSEFVSKEDLVNTAFWPMLTINYSDIEAPNITIEGPLNQTYTFTNISLNYSVTDNFNVSSCWYSLNGASNVTLAGCLNTTINATAGSNNIIVYSNDTSGNVGNKSVVFSVDIDTTLPQINITLPQEGQSFGDIYDISLNFSVVEANLDSCWYSLNGASNVTLAGCLNTTINATAGTNNIIVYANDSFANVGNSSLRTFTVIYDTLLDMTVLNIDYTSFPESGNQTFIGQSAQFGSLLENLHHLFPIVNYSYVNGTPVLDANISMSASEMGIHYGYFGYNPPTIHNHTHSFNVPELAGNNSFVAVNFTDLFVPDGTNGFIEHDDLVIALCKNSSGTTEQLEMRAGTTLNWSDGIVHGYRNALEINLCPEQTLLSIVSITNFTYDKSEFYIMIGCPNCSTDEGYIIPKTNDTGSDWFEAGRSFETVAGDNSWSQMSGSENTMVYLHRDLFNFTAFNFTYNSSFGVYMDDSVRYVLHEQKTYNYTANATKQDYVAMTKTEQIVTEEVDPDINIDSLADISTTYNNPQNGITLEYGRINMTWSAFHPKGLDYYYANLTYANGTSIHFNDNITSHYSSWNASLFTEVNAIYNLTVWANASVDGNFSSQTIWFYVNDTLGPSVFDIMPISGTSFNVSDAIEIAANVTDSFSSVDSVLANVTLPNGTVETLSLANVGGDKYNASFTIPNLEGIYNVIIIANDSFGNLNETSVTFFVDTIFPTLSNIFIEPYDPSIGGNVSISADADDNVGVSGVFANITLPNGTVETVSLPANYTIQLAGRHNITILANDTSGNIVTFDDYLIGGTVPINVTFNVINSNLTGIPINFTAYFTGTNDEVSTANFTGTDLGEHSNLIYDLLYTTLDGFASIRLNGINLTLYNNDTLGIDRNSSISEYLVVYGVNSTYGFDNVTLVLSYSGLTFSNEEDLVLEKCDNWDFITRTCISGFTDITSQAVQNSSGDYFIVTVDSLSGFGINEITPAAPAATPTPTRRIGGGGYLLEDEEPEEPEEPEEERPEKKIDEAFEVLKRGYYWLVLLLIAMEIGLFFILSKRRKWKRLIRSVKVKFGEKKPKTKKKKIVGPNILTQEEIKLGEKEEKRDIRLRKTMGKVVK